MTAVPAVSPLPRRARPLLLAAVAVCAACGLVYELVLLTLSTSLAGGGITQTSLIVAGFVAALGAGALLVKPFLGHAAAAFVAVETLLGVLGGLSAVTLYVTFSFYATSGPVLVLGTALLGALVGAEVPLLVTLLQTGRTDMDARGSGRLLADLNAADYAGALVGGLIWPFVLLPAAGMIRGAALAGLVNVAAAAVVAALLLRRWLTRRALLTAFAALLAAAVLLGTLLYRAHDIEIDARQRLYADPIVVATRSAYQEIVVTRRGGDLRLYLDGDLQFSSIDEHRYTEALVAPALARDPARVLVLGGGDGLAARELLRHPTVRQVVQVELDPRMIELARTTFAGINRGALDDPRVRVVVADAFRWLRDPPSEPFDAVVVDMPDPDTPALGRLYSQEFYGLVRSVLAPGGLLTVQAGSAYATPDAYWRTVSTVGAAGLATTPYHVDVPSFGDWGFVLASNSETPPPLVLSAQAAPARFLDQAVLTAAGVFAPDRAPRILEPSTLDHPRIVDDLRAGYQR
ncbi:polyamine aminopropyltransferase [Frankia sp. CNm7]|uniref:Polyamine aminopropyltransferase n=1 Tax=Frankia nepalensis TaxID=1836974 RepID=A0A937RFB2_9ACTN|nr:polyamine aminopropyltransferase [Frankia nepalensis]MBL7513892.1 polyamine aminopropyltransferase [Frankia nepalensis]MBL7523976.1 polyamine aminopropyltransferase [Frankia nepalensis]MBL7626364.1 polyamine aminopropyltransferase [Frankia nepalensis]